MKIRKVKFRQRDMMCVDHAGRPYSVIADDYGNIENVLEQVSDALEAHGLELVLGDYPDYYAFRIEKKGGK